MSLLEAISPTARALFSVEDTGHEFFVLKNGQRVARRKTFADAASTALRMDYLERNQPKGKTPCKS